jgi:5-carboxymethyl-2-hydroxymuconate isomerase
MPHLTLEYSANLVGVDLQCLFGAFHDALARLGIDIDDCKSRAIGCELYRVGSGTPDRAFAHLTLALLDSRPLSVQRAAGEAMLAVMQDGFADNAHDCDLTVDVRPMNAACYFKARTSP